MNQKEIDYIFGFLWGIKNDCNRMTSGNYMHHTAAVKMYAENIEYYLKKIGINPSDDYIKEYGDPIDDNYIPEELQ